MMPIDAFPLPQVAHVAQTIQLSIAPVFMLAAIGAFLNVCAGRLARVVDRARALGPQVFVATGDEHDRMVLELRILDQRIRIINNALLASVVSATLVCLLIMLLFASELGGGILNRTIAILFISAVGALAAAFILFIREIMLAARSLRVEPHILLHTVDKTIP